MAENQGNFANDPQRAAEAGQKGGRNGGGGQTWR
ncbi:KGG domain-containing protein [Streptomyces albus]